MVKRFICWIVLAGTALSASIAYATESPLQLAYLHPLSDMTHCDKVLIGNVFGDIKQQFDLPVINGCISPVWSPDGNYLAVWYPGMVLIDLKSGTTQDMGAVNEGWIVDSPVWSRDGQYLAWHETKGGGAEDQRWKVLHITDKTVKTVASLSEVSTAPDTMQFMHMESDGLYTIGTDITPQRIALPQTMDCASPIASFGLLFVCVEMNDLVLLDTLMMGGKSINLTNTPDLQESNAQWSPDKSQIVYQTYDPNTHKTWLNRVSKSGTDAEQLTTPTGDNYDVQPQWSPDGQYITFERHGGYKGLDTKIYVIKADGTELQYVGDGIYPAWRPINQS